MHTHTKAATATPRAPLARPPTPGADQTLTNRVTAQQAEVPQRTAGSLALNAWLIGQGHRSLEDLACGLHGARRGEKKGDEAKDLPVHEMKGGH